MQDNSDIQITQPGFLAKARVSGGGGGGGLKACLLGKILKSGPL